jgi:hypothetical protein
MLRSERLRYLMLKHRLSERVSYRLALALDRWNRVSRPYPPMSSVTRERLLDHYRPTVDAVEARLGRPLRSWRT